MLNDRFSRRDFVKTLAAGAALSKSLELRATSKRVGSTAQRLKEKPYEKRVCRVENYPSCLMPEDSYVGLSVEEYVDLIYEAGLEVQIVSGEIEVEAPKAIEVTAALRSSNELMVHLLNDPTPMIPFATPRDCDPFLFGRRSIPYTTFVSSLTISKSKVPVCLCNLAL